MTLAKMKSAKALSGEIPLKSEEFSGLLWIRRHTENKKMEIKLNSCKTILISTLLEKLLFGKWELQTAAESVKLWLVWNFMFDHKMQGKMVQRGARTTKQRKDC